MSCAAVNSIQIKLLITYLLINSVVGYENAYDLLERRNEKRFYEPHRRFYQSPETFMNLRDGDRYFSHNRNPYSVFTTTRPYFSKLGNGYDNLGNGIPVHHFQSFPQERRDYRYDNWELERHPFQGRGFNSRFDFKEGSYLRTPQRYDYPKYDYHYPNAKPATSRRNNEFGSRVDRFLEDNEDKKQKKTDEIFQRSYEGVNMDSAKKEKTGEHSHADQTGENKSSLRSNKVVKKGHTTKGFASHHHKDETGNSTTYFDESSDFGGQSDFKDIADGFGTRKTLDQITDTEDEKYYKENGGQSGDYGSGLLIGNQKFEKDFSSDGRHEETRYNDKDHDDIGLRKTFHYLNGDKFDFSEPHSDNYY